MKRFFLVILFSLLVTTCQAQLRLEGTYNATSLYSQVASLTLDIQQFIASYTPVVFTGGTLTSNLTMSDGTYIEIATGSLSVPALRFRKYPNTGVYGDGTGQMLFKNNDGIAFWTVPGPRLGCASLGVTGTTYFSGHVQNGYDGENWSIRGGGAPASSTNATFGWPEGLSATTALRSGLGKHARGQPSMVASESEAQRWTNQGTNIYGDGVECVRVASSGVSIKTNLTMDDGTIIELATGSATVPSLRLRGDTDTSIYSPVANTWHFRCGGSDVLRISPTAQGFYTSGGFSLAISESTGYIITNADIISGNTSAGYAMLKNRAGTVTSTRPVFTYTTDEDSGLGRESAGKPSIISDGVECVRVASSGTQIFQPLTYPYYTASSTTPVATTTYYTTGWSFTADGILVDIGGVIQSGGGIDYTETPPNLITFASEVATGSRVTIRNR